MRIDSHQHFWRLSRNDYGWLRPDDPALAPLIRDYLPEDFESLRHRHGVSRSVLVQAAPSVGETEFLLELAARHDFIGGVVGWVDLTRPDATQTLERLAEQPKFKGVRPMLQDLPHTDWIARAPHPDAVRALIRLGLRFDALIRPEHMQPLLTFLRAWPELPAVIDHAAKPRLARGWEADWVAPWRRSMGELAALPQVHCKFSGLMTELPATALSSNVSTRDSLRAVWATVLELFGPGRLMWGSDWPVVNLAGGYATWVALSEALVGDLPPLARALVWSGTAIRFYGIGEQAVST